MSARFAAWYGTIQLVWLGLFYTAPWWVALLPAELYVGAWLVLFAVVSFDLRERRIAQRRRFEAWRARSVK